MLASFEACDAGVKAVEEALGPVDIVVNNAGITRDATMKRMSPDMWSEVINVNLGGCYNMAKATWDGMTARKFGRIVNIGSINGQAGQYGQVNYAAAKSGIHGFTKALAQEGARLNITVNAIAPGYIDTEMVAAVPADVLEKIKGRIPVGSAWLCRGNRTRRAVPGFGRWRLRYRIDVVDQRRSAHVLTRGGPSMARVAVVTGGTRGIGLAITEELHAKATRSRPPTLATTRPPGSAPRNIPA